MTKRVNTLEQVGEVISAGEPVDLDYVLGSGSERKELVITHNDRGKKDIERVTSSSVHFRLYDDSGEIEMDITGPRGRSLFTGLTPRGAATYIGPQHPRPDSGTLEMATGENSFLGFSEHYREE